MPVAPARHFVASGLAVRAGARTLLAGLELDLAAGEVVTVRGPSGCGKTTLLRTLAFLQDPVAGEVRLRGRTAAELGWTAWRRQVSLVAQVPAVFPGTVRANLARPFTYHVADRPFPEDRARWLLDQVHLQDATLDDGADRLSVGQQLRLVTVRSLLLEPSVLLLDEPTSALDPDSATLLEDLVREDARTRRSAVIAVTHDPARAGRWSDRTLDLAGNAA